APDDEYLVARVAFPEEDLVPAQRTLAHVHGEGGQVQLVERLEQANVAQEREGGGGRQHARGPELRWPRGGSGYCGARVDARSGASRPAGPAPAARWRARRRSARTGRAASRALAGARREIPDRSSRAPRAREVPGPSCGMIPISPVL